MIEFKNVYKTYPNGFTALKNISLQIEQGEFVAIIGLSGAGKSTILRCINACTTSPRVNLRWTVWTWTLSGAKNSEGTAAR